MQKMIVCFLAFSAFLLQGCSHEQFTVSYQLLAQKMIDPNTQETEYSKVTEEYQALTSEEYSQFMRYQAQAMVDKNPAYQQNNITVDQVYEELVRRNTQSLELYGISYNQLSLDQAEKLIELYPDPNEISSDN